ncbi:MAG: TetR/AcrR family transcriptional regulator [Planctomycetes bacterium]|nr:TetR/AcrR family transcriptional regulator [Planctomycetota bacterium]
MARPIEKREHIERGVVEVVARKGLRGTPIQDIADEANVSPGLLYRYWKNRDDLAGEVYREHYHTLVERLATAATREPNLWGKVSVMLREFLEFADENPTILKFLLLSQHELHDSVPAEQGIRSFVHAMLREGMAAGQVRKMDPDLASQLLLGIVLQPVVGALHGHMPTPLVQHHAAIVQALRHVFLDGEASTAKRD